jgi:hypothetical protein
MVNYPDKILLGEGHLDLGVSHLTPEVIQEDRGLKLFRSAVAQFFDDDYPKRPKYRLVLEKIDE